MIVGREIPRDEAAIATAAVVIFAAPVAIGFAGIWIFVVAVEISAVGAACRMLAAALGF